MPKVQRIGSPRTVSRTISNSNQRPFVGSGLIVYGGGGSSTPVAPDYTALLTAIRVAVESIDTDTDNLASILAAVDGLEALTTTGNATLNDIKAALLVIQTEAQAINANTDQLETLLSTYTTLFQAESDQTQVLITDTNTKLDTLIAESNVDQEHTSATKFHIGSTNYYSREIVTYDNETFIEVSRTKQYSTDGVVWTNTAPVGTAVIGWYEVPTVTPATIVPGALDITTDFTNIGGNITNYGIPSTVKSLTLLAHEDVELNTPYGVKKLYADKSYTWNQGTNVDMDISSFDFLTDNKLIEVIFDI